MSHGIDGHNAPDGAGLRRLAPGEALVGCVRVTLGPNSPSHRTGPTT